MARSSIQVTYKSTDGERIPDALTEGATLLMDLGSRGRLDDIGQRVRIRRQGGYCGLDVWVLLFVFFTTGASQGVRTFWDKLRRHVLQLGALAGRRSLPAPASLSRALDVVELDLLRGEPARWLLTGSSDADVVLEHPAVQTYDACGDGWHVFDLDPTVTTLHHRALPNADELPEPRRRSEHTGAPGHSGRKRGDIQHRRVTVQHAGSGLWVHAHLSPGNGEGVADFERALDSIVATCARLEHPLSHAVVRMDGEYGHVPSFTACRERQLPFLTRLNRAQLYEDPEVLKRLRSAVWHRVPDSLAGPQRAAADLGVLTVHAGQRTRRPDGGAYEPIEVRVVASIFPKKGKAKRGKTVDGWQVELFAVDLPADAWPAPEAITAYFGRTAEENRFAQEDRELGLDRIISYHLPGQELATLVGLSLWNLRLARGFALEPPPHERPAPALRRAQVDDRVPGHWPRDPVLLNALAELDWSALLSRRPGWEWDPTTGELVCGDGRGLALTSVRPAEHATGRTGLIFRRPVGGCDDCLSREGCLRTTRGHASKHAEVAVPTATAERLRQRLALVRGKESNPRPRATSIKPIEADPGPRAVADALFLPATARHVFEAIFSGSTIRVRVEIPPAERPKPRLVALDVGDRQRRRKTWAQNLDRYGLPEDAQVGVEVSGSQLLRTLLGEQPHPKLAAARASA